MSQYESFFINAQGQSNQCQELNRFLKTHVIIRVVENIISTGTNCGIQLLIEYNEIGEGSRQDRKNARIDWRASLANDEQRELFDKLKAVRLKLASEKNLKAAYLVCKDEHLAAMVQRPDITVEEIMELPHSNNILLKEFASSLHREYQKILVNDEINIPNKKTDEESDFTF